MADNGKGKAERAAWRGAFGTAEAAMQAAPPADGGNEKLRLYAVTDPAGDTWFTWASGTTWATENVAVALGFKAAPAGPRPVGEAQVTAALDQLPPERLQAILQRYVGQGPAPALKVVPAPEVVPAEEALEVAEGEAAYLAEETGRTKGKKGKGK